MFSALWLKLVGNAPLINNNFISIATDVCISFVNTNIEERKRFGKFYLLASAYLSKYIFYILFTV